MSAPVKKDDGWYVHTPDGESGPWLCKEAADEAADENWFQANYLNNKIKSKKAKNK